MVEQRTSSPLIQGFLTDLAKTHAPQSIVHYASDIGMFCDFLLSSATETQEMAQVDVAFFQAIGTAEVEAFLQWMTQEKNAKEGTKNRKIAVLQVFFRYLENKDVENPMGAIPWEKGNSRSTQSLCPQEVEALLLVVNGAFWIRDTAILRLLSYGGLRVSELVALTMGDVAKLAEGTLWVADWKGRTNPAGREIALSYDCVEALEDYLDIRPSVEDATLFLSQRKKPLSIRSVQAMTQKYAQAAGLEDCSCHSLRLPLEKKE